VEPLTERLTFSRLDVFDWIVMGGQSASYFNGTPALQPEWEWVEHLWLQARAAGLAMYWKDNLTVRPNDLPAPRRTTHADA
jgi:protein gp37